MNVFSHLITFNFFSNLLNYLKSFLFKSGDRTLSYEQNSIRLNLRFERTKLRVNSTHSQMQDCILLEIVDL